MSRRCSDARSVFSMGDEWGPRLSLCCIPRSKSRSSGILARKLSRKGSRLKSTLLTGQQRLIILKTWHKMSVDIPCLGICTMVKLLELDFEIKNMFEFRHKTAQECQLDPQFRQHAFWLIQAVNAVVENLDTLEDTVADTFFEIGEKHAAIPNFHISLFTILPEAWHFAWEDQLRERYTTQAERSWELIFRYIVNRLAEGYEHCIVGSPPSSVPASIAAATVHSSLTGFTSSTSTRDFESSGSDSSDEETDTTTTEGIPHFFIPKQEQILPEAWHFAWEDQLRERYTTQAERSWELIFRYIVNRLAEGYEHCIVGSPPSSVPASIAAATVHSSLTGFTSSTSTRDFESSGSDSSDEETDTTTTEGIPHFLFPKQEQVNNLHATVDTVDGDQSKSVGLLGFSVQPDTKTSQTKENGHALISKSDPKQSTAGESSAHTRNTDDGFKEKSCGSFAKPEHLTIKGSGSERTAVPLPSRYSLPSKEPDSPAANQGD